MSEYSEQCLIFQWCELQKNKYPELKLLNASLNGVKLTKGQAMKAKRSGMKKGYPDIFLPVPRSNYAGLFIELKYGRNTASKEQKEWLQELSKQGYLCAFAWGADNAIKLITKYLTNQMDPELKVLKIK